MELLAVGGVLAGLYAVTNSDPHALPKIIPKYNMPDTDDTNPHNYPSKIENEKIDHVDNDGGTSLEVAYGQTRGFCDAEKFGPADIRNTNNSDGVYPLFGRTPLTPLTIDPLEGKYFKPPKSTILQDDLREAPKPNSIVFGAQPITAELRSNVVNPYTKFNSASGQLNHMYPSQPCATTRSYGFSNGEKFTVRTGGFHPRQRLYREVPSTRKQLYFSIRNPSSAVGRIGSIVSQGRGELGALEIPYNAGVKDWHREPMPTAGIVSNRQHINPSTVLKCTTRPDQYIGWTGPAGSTGGQSDLRLKSICTTSSTMCGKGRDVIPNKTTMFSLTPIGEHAVGQGRGPVESNAVTPRDTNRGCYDANTMRVFGGSLPLDGVADAIKPIQSSCSNTYVGGCADHDTKRINGNNLRATQKDTGMFFNINRPFHSTRTLAPQYTEYPKPVDRKVTPMIRMNIESSLLNPYKQNPYTQPLPVM